MIDLHRHDEFSLFDGFGKPQMLVELAKKNNLKALGLANHGNTSGLVEHYFACVEGGIKPILGVEAYFQPKFDKEKERFHICLFAKNLIGYGNINRIMSIANKEKFYYKPNVDFELLEKYSDGIICTSACIQGPVSFLLANGKINLACKVATKFKEIYEDDFYFEIQPYKLTEVGLQELVNKKLIKLSEKLSIQCILTSDSHYGRKEDFDTYLKMHEIAGTKMDVGETYYERHMPEDLELEKRFCEMHKKDFVNVKDLAKQMRSNLLLLNEKVEPDILSQLELKMPEIQKSDSKKILKQKIISGLKVRGKYNEKYLKRCQTEYNVIVHHGFEDYFLIVQDYVKYAKDNGIAVGPGRGSVCNCQIAWALGITEVDSMFFGLDYTRFLRKDKKKLPDIDLDFETERRQEVIDYLINKYPKQAIQICSYGLYKEMNLLNDLFKVCGVEEKSEQTEIKKFVNSLKNAEGVLDIEAMNSNFKTKQYNKMYDNIFKHFTLMYKKVRYIGTHAAGVAIVGGDILDYTAIRKSKSGLKDEYNSVYDLNDLERINAIKFDILGLKNMSSIKELQELTGEYFSYDWLKDKEVYEMFKQGNNLGIFQFERPAVKEMMLQIQPDCFEDIIAMNALNRPGPLSLRMPEQYAKNKFDKQSATNSTYWEYTKNTYGTIVYQEQITAICRGIGKMTWSDSDRVLKFMKGTQMTERSLKAQEKEEKELKESFISGCVSSGLTKAEALEIFDKITVYSFNKGHATGYAMIAYELMWYKTHYPTEFYYTIMKYASDEALLAKYEMEAAVQGVVILLPHVNGSADYELYEGGQAIRKGLSVIKNVGINAAKAIETERIKNGKYVSEEDLTARLPKRVVNKRALDALREAGALAFDEEVYKKRNIKYNSALILRGGEKNGKH